jgi:uncharacterized protein with FMN-binding domain
MAKRVSRKIVALSSSAVAAVYLAGFMLTQSAADEIAQSEASGLPGVETAAPPGRPAAGDVPVALVPPLNLGQSIQRSPTPTSTPLQVFVLPTLAPISTATPTVSTISGSTPTRTPAAPDPTSTSRAAPALPPATSTATIPTVTPSAVRPNLAPAAPTATPSQQSVARIATPTTAPTIAPTTAPAAAAGAYKDGVYVGNGTSRRGDAQVTVTVKNGRIVSAVITRSTLQYPLSRIASLPGEVVDRQSAKVDTITGATLSSQAFQMAVRQALAQAA